MNRRRFLQASAASAGAFSLPDAFAAKPNLMSNAEHCVMLWLGGGMSQIDTFDPKKLGDAKSRKPGAYYPAIETSVPGVQVCEHLKQTARRMHHVTAVRTVHHSVVDEHAAAANRMHTGRLTSGTVTYPSIGSIVAHERGSAAEGVPAYVLIGYPNITRGPGFLGPEAGFIYLTDIESGPAGLARPRGLASHRISRREELLGAVRQGGLAQFPGDQRFAEYDATLQQSLRLSGPEFMTVFNLAEEPSDLRNAYGGGFGQRCLLSRRLFQAGVRFVEISYSDNFKNGTGWDTHNQGQLKQHLLIQDLDAALSTLIADLELHAMLDKTLIVINSEFGRPGGFDSGGGRGHHSKCFTCVLAGGGLKHQGAWGVSSDTAEQIIEQPVSVPDLFATIFATLGIDHRKNLYDGDRPVPITNMGEPIAELFA